MSVGGASGRLMKHDRRPERAHSPGPSEIGGTCVELRAGGERLVLDAGMPMTPPWRGAELLPDVPGRWVRGDGSLRAVRTSHPHPDHHGLADLVDASVPVFLGDR